MRFSTALSALVAAPLLVSAAKDSRTFAVNHLQGKGLVYGRMDPIISPGTDSAHVHLVMGGNGFSDKMADNDALDSTCTNSLIKGDGSNYWVPMLYFNDGTMFHSVELDYMQVYYFFEPTDDDIVPFEPGFRMISGDPFARSPPAAGGASVLDPARGPVQPIQFTCPTADPNTKRYPVNSNGLGGVGVQDPANKGAGAGFPNVDCDGASSPLRMDIHFPSCYNPGAGLANYQNNTAFPSSEGATGGRQNCPKGWLHLPHLFYEVYWNTPAFKDQWKQGGNTQPFVLAPGDPTGYGAHGDFFSGWKKDTLTELIKSCNAGDRGMEKCDNIPGGLVSSAEAAACKITAPNPEQVLGNFTALPGCNPIQSGPERAAVIAPGCPTSGSSATSNSAPSTSSSFTSAPSAPISGQTSAPASATPSGPSGPLKQPSAMAFTSSAEAYLPTKPAFQLTASSSAVVSSAAPTGTVASTSALGNPAPSGWTYAGCFADSKSARVLLGSTTNLLTTMTIDKCTAYCTQQGFAVAGLEWKSECYCGNNVPTQQSDQCTTPCVGDANTACGGGSAISVYNKGAATKRHANHMSAHARRRVHGQ